MGAYACIFNPRAAVRRLFHREWSKPRGRVAGWADLENPGETMNSEADSWLIPSIIVELLGDRRRELSNDVPDRPNFASCCESSGIATTKRHNVGVS